MRLVEKHIIKDNRFEDICLKSGLLYNYVLYNARKGIFNKEYLNEYEFSTKLCRENQFDFRNLPTSVSQQVVGQVFKNIKSWIRLKKDFENNPSKYDNCCPHLPSYKKGKKQNMVVFTTSACRLKKIDLGLNNLCSCISNAGLVPFIVNGRIMKSFNQWYNKRKAKLMSYVGGKGTSERLRQLNNYRNFWIEDYIHKVSRYIVNYCITNNIGSIVIGLNKGWKQKINLGKKINQKFVEIPFSRLIDKISYKCKLVGISFQINEESYTSKVDHLAFEKLGKHDVYLGKRKKRGLFQSSVGKLLNADINGAIGIGRKVFGDSFVNMIIDSGFAFNPIRVNIL